jgi:hypothetical protein
LPSYLNELRDWSELTHRRSPEIDHLIPAG